MEIIVFLICGVIAVFIGYLLGAILVAILPLLLGAGIIYLIFLAFSTWPVASGVILGVILLFGFIANFRDLN